MLSIACFPGLNTFPATFPVTFPVLILRVYMVLLENAIVNFIFDFFHNFNTLFLWKITNRIWQRMGRSLG